MIVAVNPLLCTLDLSSSHQQSTRTWCFRDGVLGECVAEAAAEQLLWLLLQETLVSQTCKMVPPCKFVCVGQRAFLEGESSCLNLAVNDSLMP